VKLPPPPSTSSTRSTCDSTFQGAPSASSFSRGATWLAWATATQYWWA
jgi:hypothetical protein